MEDPDHYDLNGTQRRASNKSNRSRVRPSRRPEYLHERKKCQPTNIYVKIHDVIQDINLLADVLTSKVNIPGLKLIPTETCVRRNDRYTFCSLTCESKSDAKKLKNLIMKDRSLFKPLIDCSFRDFVSAEEQRQFLIKTKADLQKKVENEFDTLSEQVLQQHNEKLAETQKRIHEAINKLHDLYTAKKAREEIEALEHKQEELELQQKEFITATRRFQQKLVSLLKEDSYHMRVQELRKQFGVECCRLEKALPMYARRQDIIHLVEQNPVSILLAETGSGKSTQVVQYLLDTALADQGTIVCTQPRKIAAVSLATHVAQELASSVGKEVGYKAGMRVKTSSFTKVVYMTDHALLNECLTDPDLKAYSCVVVDEAHERSLFTDLLMSMVKRCVRKRSDLRVIITSATIDPQVFVDYFGACPIMKVSGRAFPVDVVWQDSTTEENDFESYVDQAVNKAIDIHVNQPPGDILVFLTSAAEIQKCCDTFQQKMKDRTDFRCFQLHGQLQADEQQKVFEPLDRNKRKIVFATNCAETSITIDGIKYVVDTGVAKEMRYDPKRNIRSLEVTIISQSSAEQRKGRAGRTASGTCYRLYSQRSFQSMTTISLPEILKTHLGHALLKLAELGVRPDQYDFVQSPSPESINAALTALDQLGAMKSGVITDIGRWVAKLPFDPKLGLMTLYGLKQQLLFDTIVFAALVSAGSSLFYRGQTEEEKMNLNKSKLKFCHAGGDSITSLQVYKTWQTVDEKQKNKWCASNSVNAKAMRGVRDTVNEVCKVLQNYKDLKIVHQFSEAQDTHDNLRKILFKCNASNLCHYLGHQKAGYFAAQASRQVHFHPSSALCFLANSPEWVVYDQLLHTSRHFITGITPVDNEWVKDLSKGRCGFDVDLIRQKKLKNVFTQPAGSHTYFAMVGTKYTNLRQLQEKWGAVESQVVVVDASQETREVKVFCTGMAAGLDELTEELRQVAQNAIKEVQQEVWEVPIGEEQSGLRVLLGQGASINDILMPHETRKVFILKPSDVASEEVMRQKFERFGKIVQIRQFPDSNKWGFLMFQTAGQAKAAVEATSEDENDAAQLEHRRHTKHNAVFRARLSWNRRRAKGIGFVSISPVYMEECLAMSSLYIGQSLVTMKPGRKSDNSLFLTRLPTDVTEDLIKRSILHALGQREDAEDIIESVSVPREPVKRTDEQELNRLKNEIQRKIDSLLTHSTAQVTVYRPKSDKTAEFKAEASFSDPTEGLAACKNMCVHFSLDGARVSVEPVLSASLRVSRLVHDACRTELIEVKSRLDKEVEVTVKPQGSDHYMIFIKANDMEDLIEARTCLNDVIRGEVLECNDAPAISHLLSSSGRQMLKEAERETSAHIIVDNRQRTVSIHGSPEDCRKVRQKIDDYLQEVRRGTETEVLLCGHGKPPGLLKALYEKHGEDLDLLRQETDLHSISVDYRRHSLKLRGPAASVQKAQQAVEKVEQCVAAACSSGTADDSDGVDCAACLCPIDQGQLYRLEACAHPFCKDCVARQVIVAIKDHQFPVLCCQDGCNLPLAWRDFRYLSGQGHIKIPELASNSLSAFVLANRDKAQFCNTPDCPMVYRVTSEDKGEIFLCPVCNVRTCTACHQHAHDGMTCAMLRSCKDVGKGVEDWVREDPKNRKACPGCKSPIQKTEGCNKMLCTACGSIFCWLCTQKFSSDGQCYDHLTENHNGIFAEADLLYL